MTTTTKSISKTKQLDKTKAKNTEVQINKTAGAKPSKLVKSTVEPTKKKDSRAGTKPAKKATQPVLKTAPNTSIDNEYFQYLKITAGSQ